MAIATDACRVGHFCVEPGIFVLNLAFLFRTSVIMKCNDPPIAGRLVASAVTDVFPIVSDWAGYELGSVYSLNCCKVKSNLWKSFVRQSPLFKYLPFCEQRLIVLMHIYICG